MNKKAVLIVSILIVSMLALAFTLKGNKIKRKVIFTEAAPKPIGPYSQAILVDKTLYVAGQVGINPMTGKLDTSGIEGQTRQAMQNIYSILLAAEMNMTHITKTSIYLKNIKDFEKVNKEYGNYFSNMPPPARETIGVGDLPKGAGIEISVIAVK